LKGAVMKQIVAVAVVVIGSVAVWTLGSQLSADAVGMAIGIILGVLAGIPASLLILVGSRRRSEHEEPHWERERQEHMSPAYQPPVIVLANAPQPAQPPMFAPAPPHAVDHWPQRSAARQFKIVGEQEQWME
jgi:hypothetical protein